MQDYDAFNNGVQADIFLKKSDGSLYEGKVWPGVTAFPDWFHPNTQGYWDYEFVTFFNADTGVDIDALWIDMNEPSNFCEYPCEDPGAKGANIEDGIVDTTGQKLESQATVSQEVKPQPKARSSSPQVDILEHASRQAKGTKKGLPGRDLINPKYKIRNEFGSLSNKTANTDLIHQGGWAEYDTHNL